MEVREMEVKIVQIGNSKGVRLPKRLLVKYGFGETVVMKELDNGVLIERDGEKKLSWAETYQAMSQADEDWSDWAELDVEEME